MASGLTPGCHVMSDLLTIREKGILLALLEPQCQLIKTTVAQVVEAHGEEQCWECLGCGVLCLIKDESVCSYFLRLYCVKSAKLLWEQELYIPFKYNATRTFFHTFPADACHVGLNFANEAEAEEFHLIMEAVQKEQETTDMMSEIINADEEESSTGEAANSGIQPLEHSDEELSAFIYDPYANDPLPTRKTRLTEDQSDTYKPVIHPFGDLNAAQTNWRNRVRDPSPLTPSSSTSQEAPQGSETPHQIPPWIPLPPSTPAPVVPERIRKSASFTCSKK